MNKKCTKSHYSYTDIIALCENRERNALIPNRLEACRQVSSTDVRSAYDPEIDRYLYWDANAGDGYGSQGVIDIDGSRYFVAIDVEGAGYIASVWFGTLLDEGKAQLIVDGKEYDNGGNGVKDLFEARGKFKGLDGLIYNTPGPAWVFHLPITFNKSCKILLKEGWGLYYHVDYVLFGEGMTVETFPNVFTEEQHTALLALSERFSNEYHYAPARPAPDNISLRANECKTVFEAAGEGAIDSICIKFKGFSEMDRKLREKIATAVTLSAYWDGENSPSVWAPVGSLCGTPLADEFGSMLMGLTEDGVFFNRFLMPYAKGARIELRNESDIDLQVEFAAETATLSRPIQEYCRFHAKWNRNGHPVLRPDRFPDHTLLKTSGKGRFLGVSFHAYEREDYGWWGEGDEKIFVDGEKFPSWFGTGSEDYFEFCWGKPVMFHHPCHAQIRQDGGFYGAGHKVDLRLHHLDSIPFQSSIEVCIEKYLEEEKVSYDVVPFWYLSTDGMDDYTPVSYCERVSYWEDYHVVSVEQILLRDNELTLNVNDEHRIYSTIIPVNHTDNREIVWTSSDPETVSVDSRGQVLALKAGRALLTASIGRVKAGCTVLVNPLPQSHTVPSELLGHIKNHTVAFYDFSDAESIGKDISGNGRDLSEYTFIDGEFKVCPEALKRVPAINGKSALFFDGVTFLMSEKEGNDVFDGLESFTITYRSHMPAWNADATREMRRNYKTLFDKGGYCNESGWFFASENDTLLAANEFFSSRGDSGELINNICNLPHFHALTWQQITCTVDGPGGKVAMYINGELHCEKQIKEAMKLTSAHPLTIGAVVRKGEKGLEIVENSGFVGELTDIRILDIALTGEEVAALK